MAKNICSKCGREKPDKDFFKYKSGECSDICIDCLTMHIDNQDDKTFTWILEKFDVPYIKKKWIELCNRSYQKNPGAFGPKSIIGTYLRTMKMAQYKDLTYADSDRLNFADEKLQQEAEARRATLANDEETIAYVEELQQKLAAGEITEAEFKTLNPLLAAEQKRIIPEFIKPVEVNEEDILAKLTDEDRTYLATKWGLLYKPSQWVHMENMYNQYAEEYNLNADRRETLIKMCKTSLKMDECLDIGDVNGYKNLSFAWDQLRKSGKFTEAQKEANETKVLDTIGELVALCEREGGIIEQFPSPDDYPQDKIDLTIKDLKSYVYNLVTNELGLGNLIESFIQKYEKAEEERQKENIMDTFILSKEDEEKDMLSDEDAYDFHDYLDNELQKDIDNLMSQVAGE